MPSRPSSFQILSGLWPEADADEWSDVAEGLHKKARELDEQAGAIRKEADGLYPDCSGHMVDGMAEMFRRNSKIMEDHAQTYSTMANVVNETARIIYGLRTDLDHIDAAADEKIQEIKKKARGGGIGASVAAAAIVNEIAQMVAQARADATAKSAEAAAAIAAYGARIGAGVSDAGTGGGDSSPGVDPELQRLQQSGLGGGGHPGPGSMPTFTPPGGFTEQGGADGHGDRPTPGSRRADRGESSSSDNRQQPVGPDGTSLKPGDEPGQHGSDPGPPVPAKARADWKPDALAPPVPTPSSPVGGGGGGGGGPGVPLGTGGGGSGVRMPPTGLPQGQRFNGWITSCSPVNFC
jgi:hypothetical protein